MLKRLSFLLAAALASTTIVLAADASSFGRCASSATIAGERIVSCNDAIELLNSWGSNDKVVFRWIYEALGDAHLENGDPDAALRAYLFSLKEEEREVVRRKLFEIMRTRM